MASTVAAGTYSLTVSGQADVDGRRVTRTAGFSLEVLAPETTAVTGRVLTAEAVPQPIPGVTLTLGSVVTLTDSGGNFVLLAPPAGTSMMRVDGQTASTADAQYPPVEVKVSVNATGPSRVPFIIYLPKLDTAHPIPLPLDATGAVTATVRATTPLVPGLVVTIPAGTRITGPDGTPVAQITITPVPVDRSPMPFPPGTSPPMLLTLQPGGAVPSTPLPITFPNQRAPAGTKADLYFFDVAAGDWAIWGQGTVSSNGTQIVSDAGAGLPRFAWHWPQPQLLFDPAGPPDLMRGRPSAASPWTSPPGTSSSAKPTSSARPPPGDDRAAVPQREAAGGAPWRGLGVNPPHVPHIKGTVLARMELPKWFRIAFGICAILGAVLYVGMSALVLYRGVSVFSVLVSGFFLSVLAVLAYLIPYLYSAYIATEAGIQRRGFISRTETMTWHEIVRLSRPRFWIPRVVYLTSERGKHARVSRTSRSHLGSRPPPRSQTHT